MIVKHLCRKFTSKITKRVRLYRLRDFKGLEGSLILEGSVEGISKPTKTEMFAALSTSIAVDANIDRTWLRMPKLAHYSLYFHLKCNSAKLWSWSTLWRG